MSASASRVAVTALDVPVLPVRGLRGDAHALAPAPTPVLSPAGLGQWQLDLPLLVDDARLGRTFVVPAGFVTDLASVPRVCWPLVAPFDLSCAAPIAHDWLYRHAGRFDAWTYTRAAADALFRDLMAHEGVPRWRRVAGYAGVRAFGGASWGASPALVLPAPLAVLTAPAPHL